MRKIVYYVATSIDGFISGRNEDISGFVQKGNGVDQYLQDLKQFDTVIMGRKTYEFGYKFGLKPGQAPYPHLNHLIFSNSLNFENQAANVQISKVELNKIEALKNEEGANIYLCGGGKFAGWLIDNKMIDILKIKLNPLILGDGVRIFGSSKKQYKLEMKDSKKFDDGIQIITYQIEY